MEMSGINKVGVFVMVFLLTLVVFIPELEAQCPMCKMAAESNLQNGGSAGKGLNAGILYMLATPYILIGTIGYIWWKNKKSDDETDEATA